MLKTSDHSDSLILNKIRTNSLTGWEELYNSYATPMLSIIYKLTENKNKAEEILIKIFTAPVFKDFLWGIKSGLSLNVCRFAFCYAARELNRQGLSPDSMTIFHLPKPWLFLYNKTMNDIHVKETPPVSYLKSYHPQVSYFLLSAEVIV